MTFWLLQQPASRLGLADEAAQENWTYGQLSEAVSEFTAARPSGPKQLGFILCQNRPGPLVAYLSSLQAGDVTCLLSAALDSGLLDNLYQVYRPNWIWLPETMVAPPGYRPTLRQWGFRRWVQENWETYDLHPDLAVLLSTSGTTGSPKMVRLSHRNLQANAESIREYLAIQPDERPITTLPMHYSYGLSVINSHLSAGATLLLTDHSVATREFWTFFKAQGATSIAGVPYTYQMLHRMRLDRMDLPTLRILTQAGGRLDDKSAQFFSQVALERGWKFFRMYGQTEATARISFVPAHQAIEKIGSVGIPIPGGSMEIDPETSELLYRGANVMLGYAEGLADLARGDDYRGVLRTGDLARQDEDGYYYLTGRLKRFVKLFGLRIGLDELERHIERETGSPVACIGEDEKLLVILEDASRVEDAKALLNHIYKIRPPAAQVFAMENFPRSLAGKVNYAKLKELINE